MHPRSRAVLVVILLVTVLLLYPFGQHPTARAPRGSRDGEERSPAGAAVSGLVDYLKQFISVRTREVRIIARYPNGTQQVIAVKPVDDPLTNYFWERLGMVMTSAITIEGMSGYGMQTDWYAAGGSGPPYKLAFICLLDALGTLYCGHAETTGDIIIANMSSNPITIINGPVRVIDQLSSQTTFTEVAWAVGSTDPTSNNIVMYIPINVTLPAGVSVYVQWRVTVTLPRPTRAWVVLIAGGVLGAWNYYETYSTSLGTAHSHDIEFPDGWRFRLDADRDLSPSGAAYAPTAISLYPALMGINQTSGLLSTFRLSIYRLGYYVYNYTTMTLWYQAYNPLQEVNATIISLMAYGKYVSSSAQYLEETLLQVSIPAVYVGKYDYILVNFTFAGSMS